VGDLIGFGQTGLESGPEGLQAIFVAGKGGDRDGLQVIRAEPELLADGADQSIPSMPDRPISLTNTSIRTC